jgi:hypothetical protein
MSGLGIGGDQREQTTNGVEAALVVACDHGAPLTNASDFCFKLVLSV